MSPDVYYSMVLFSLEDVAFILSLSLSPPLGLNWDQDSLLISIGCQGQTTQGSLNLVSPHSSLEFFIKTRLFKPTKALSG